MLCSESLSGQDEKHGSSVIRVAVLNCFKAPAFKDLNCLCGTSPLPCFFFKQYPCAVGCTLQGGTENSEMRPYQELILGMAGSVLNVRKMTPQKVRAWIREVWDWVLGGKLGDNSLGADGI